MRLLRETLVSAIHRDGQDGTRILEVSVSLQSHRMRKGWKCSGFTPEFVMSNSEAVQRKPVQQERQRATGTDGKSLLAPVLAPDSVNLGTRKSSSDKTAHPGPNQHNTETVGASAEPVKRKHPPSITDSGCQKRGRRDSNPQPPDRQSGTLTN